MNMRIIHLDEASRKNLLEDLLKRSPNQYGEYESRVAEIINEVKENVEISDNTEKKLEVILSQISGISDVSVVLTYSKDAKQNIVYNTKEESTADEKNVEKTVAYNEENGKKTAIVESVELPKVEGAIVVARGASSVDIRSKVANAIANVLDIPVYKVQVFEKE